MSDKPEALRLADALESDYYDDVRVTAAAAELRELHAERDALRADAERYRWLAARAHKDTAYDRYGNGARWIVGFFADNSRHALDAAIDAAREAK